jgi:hypothetical protein
MRCSGTTIWIRQFAAVNGAICMPSWKGKTCLTFKLSMTVQLEISLQQLQVGTTCCKCGCYDIFRVLWLFWFPRIYSVPKFIVNVTSVPFQAQLQSSFTWLVISQLKIFSIDREYTRRIRRQTNVISFWRWRNILAATHVRMFSYCKQLW